MRFFKNLHERFQDYFNYSSVHGFHYIYDRNLNIIERLFWVIACLASIYQAADLALASWLQFQNNAVSFAMDTSYLSWDTSFPAVAICESDSPDKIDSAATELFGEDRNMNLDFYLKDVVFFEGTCYTCVEHCGKSINCSEDFRSLVRAVRSPCEDLIGNCSWNGIEFDCCQEFRPLFTEVGYCFLLNSIQTQEQKSDFEEIMISNSQIGPGSLEFYLYESSKVYIHSAEDVPFANHPQEEKAIVPWGYSFTMKFQMNEIGNDDGLESLSATQRNCWFPSEFSLPLYRSYSYSACVVSCRASAQQRLCNCTNHLLPEIPGIKSCGIKGLECLSSYSDKLKSLRSDPADEEGIVCDCISSCTEPEFNILSAEMMRMEDSDGSKVALLLESIPTRRFRRNIVRSQLDLVVSIGGAAGLFLGGSILSIVEWFYYLFLRKKKEVSRNNFIIINRNINNIPYMVYARNILIP